MDVRTRPIGNGVDAVLRGLLTFHFLAPEIWSRPSSTIDG